MFPIKRRQFLQFAGSALATLGLSQLDIQRKGDRYGRILAQSTPRKLALLVGINDYIDNPLQGCLTDTYLQRELLITCFGFNPSDILTLANAQATRMGILQAFEEHLVKQAKPGDVVVFHYSGHGSRVSVPVCDDKDSEGDCLISTFIPADNYLSLEQRKSGGVVSDISKLTLFLLMSALPTENVTVVLDSCFSGGGIRGNLIMRALDGGTQLKLSPEEVEYQQQWRSRLNPSSIEYLRQLQAGVPKGVMLAACGRNQLASTAFDVAFNDGYGGAFTCVLIEYLWQHAGTNEPLVKAMATIAPQTTRISSTGQVPAYEVKPGSNNEHKPIYFLSRPRIPPSVGLLLAGEGDKLLLYLVGSTTQSRRAYNQGGAIFAVVDAEGHERGLVQLEPGTVKGWIGQGKMLEPKSREAIRQIVQRGAFLQERMRWIPTNLTLRLGLDASLGNDKTKAEQAIKAIKFIEALPMQETQEVEYLLGRITQENSRFQKVSRENLPSVGSIGLFTPALELIPGSFGADNESVEAAVTRLKTKFKSLLASHIVKTILNPGASRLNVAVSLSRADSKDEILATVASIPDRDTSQILLSDEQPSVGTPLQIKVINQGNLDLHVSVLLIDSEGEMTAIFPNAKAMGENAMLLKAGKILQIPEQDKFKLKVSDSLGMVEVLVIASSTSLDEALKALQNVTRGRGLPMALGEESIPVIDSLLVDLNRGARGLGVISTDRVYSVDMNQLTAMSITLNYGLHLGLM